MNILDIITVLVLIWAVFNGWKKGFVTQLLSFIGIVLAVLFAIKYGAQTGEYLHYPKNSSTVLGYITVFMAFLICIAVISRVLKKILSALGIGSLDTLLGILLSVAKYAIILCVAYSSLYTLNKDWEFFEEDVFSRSKTFTPLMKASEQVTPHLNNLKKISLK